MLTAFLGSLALLSLVLTLWQFAAAMRFPLHRCPIIPPARQGVSILKPLKGCDARTEECLRSWFAQEYAGPVQILFGVAAPNDPVCDLVRRLIDEFPAINAHLVQCPKSLGHNAKISTLIQLECEVRHEIVIVSDADVFAPANTLTQLTTGLADPKVGLCNCLYRLTADNGFAARWEAFSANVDFWSQVLQALDLKPMDFALGAAMATTRKHLRAIGGFAALTDYLADDFHLGRLIAATGAQICLSPEAVECRSAPLAFAQAWCHQLRWARTVRVCRPVGFFFSILSNASLWPVVLWSAAPSLPTTALMGFCLAGRLGTAIGIERKFIGNRPGRLAWMWLPIAKDLLQVVIWAMAFLGNRITWRGTEFRVMPDGKLVPQS